MVSDAASIPSLRFDLVLILVLMEDGLGRRVT